MDHTLEVLKKARELISHPDNWSQLHIFADANNFAVYGDDSDKVRFCSLGAIIQAITNVDIMNREDISIKVAAALKKNIPDSFQPEMALAYDVECFVSDYNDDDNTTHADVLNMFDATIKKLEKKVVVEGAIL